jgi:lipopolysaccharide heptosyltransferase I
VLVRRLPLCDYPARRIALIKPSSLGDIVHTLPVLTALRARYPQAYIAWVANRSYESLLQGHPDLDAVLAFDRGASRMGPVKAAWSYGQFFHSFRRQQFDLVVDLQGLLRSGLISAASGAARRVGFSTAREGARWFYTDLIRVRNSRELHAVERYWLAAEALGVGHLDKQFRLPIAEASRRWAAEILAGCPRPWIAMGVGSRWQTKRWPPEHFGELARRAQAYVGGTILLVGGREEIPLAARAAEFLSGNARNLTGCTSLPQLTALLSQVDVMVANDTGPLHLAAALGRPVVAPYTCTQARLNGPFGARGGVVETTVWCWGSYLKRCRRLECMAELTPDRLWPLLQEVLRTWQSSSLSA